MSSLTFSFNNHQELSYLFLSGNRVPQGERTASCCLGQPGAGPHSNTNHWVAGCCMISSGRPTISSLAHATGSPRPQWHISLSLEPGTPQRSRNCHTTAQEALPGLRLRPAMSPVPLHKRDAVAFCARLWTAVLDLSLAWAKVKAQQVSLLVSLQSSGSQLKQWPLF